MISCDIQDKSSMARHEKIDGARIAHHKSRSDMYKWAFVLLAINQQAIIARTASESKGRAVRTPLTDTAIVFHNDLCILTGSNNNKLICRERQSVWRFGMQDILPRRERDPEMSLSIRLELYDHSTVRVLYR
jgi:hypothetical protein